ncbi:MAG: sensor histidine kinase [Flammeovirgaceae bacterium]
MRTWLLLLHLSFWALFLLLKYVDYSHNFNFQKAITLVLVPNTFSAIASYVHYFFLIPILLNKKWLNYALLLCLLVAVMISLRAYAEGFFFSDIFKSNYYAIWTLNRVLNLLWTTLAFMIFISLMGFTVERFVLENQKRALENEKLFTELKYLKAQINPHFLFNTLHNLNYLVQAKSEAASEVIIKLSQIMRYMIYESNKPKVKLGQEIEYIENYLLLEGIRLNANFDLQMDTSKADVNLEVVPLILIPLVENAFKHGISDLQSENWIKIQLVNTQNKLEIMISNSLKAAHLMHEESSGLGLKNLSKHLALCYPNQYQLVTKRKPDSFEAVLSIQL